MDKEQEERGKDESRKEIIPVQLQRVFYFDVPSPQILILRWSKSAHRIIRLVMSYIRG
jgi:hypothetical protein